MPRFVTLYKISHKNEAGEELYSVEEQGPWDEQEQAENALKDKLGWSTIVLSSIQTLDAEHASFNAYETPEAHDADTERTEVSSPRIIQWNEPEV